MRSPMVSDDMFRLYLSSIRTPNEVRNFVTIMKLPGAGFFAIEIFDLLIIWDWCTIS